MPSSLPSCILRGMTIQHLLMARSLVVVFWHTQLLNVFCCLFYLLFVQYYFCRQNLNLMHLKEGKMYLQPCDTNIKEACLPTTMSAVSDHKKQYPRETSEAPGRKEEMRSFERTENFQGLKSNFGQLLQVLLYEAPGS